ncbi:MAG TPA: MFS transporter [Candidatus Prevotella stercoripullorum]|nr:MFS transporter [Candidatus Prevotella stercoripullorum]
MKKSLIALAFGTLALGIAEFVMMGILPDVAQSLGVSIPEAGHLISAYAIGVCCGAPLLVVVHKYPLKSILLVLACIILLGSTLAALSVNYWMLLAARFISGLPHGAYFGVASIVAVRLADERHKTGAVSIMVAGMTVANLFGVPLATGLSASVSWRFPFLLVVFVSLIVLYYVWKWVPSVGALPDNGFRHQFAFLKNDAPWLILAATMFANGGIFCWYSYISPLLIEGGFAADTLPALMIAAGFGMVAGNLISGRLCDRHRPGHVVAVTQCIAIASLLAVFWLADYGWVSAALMVVCTGCLFAVSSPQQFLILKHAPGGELLGGASIQVAFNMGNALGAFCGGLPIAAGLPPRYAALVGVPFIVLGLVSFIIFCRKYERKA